MGHSQIQCIVAIVGSTTTEFHTTVVPIPGGMTLRAEVQTSTAVTTCNVVTVRPGPVFRYDV